MSKDRIPMLLHLLFAATYDPGDQLSIRITNLGYYRLDFTMHIFAYLNNKYCIQFHILKILHKIAYSKDSYTYCIKLHTQRILRNIAYFESNSDVLKINFRSKNRAHMCKVVRCTAAPLFTGQSCPRLYCKFGCLRRRDSD